MGLVLLKLCAIVAGLAVIGLAFLMDRPKDLGRMSDAWRRAHRGDAESD